MQASARLIHNLKGHIDEVGRLLFSPDRKTLAACDDLIITLWDVDTGSLRNRFEPFNDQIFEMAFSPDGRWIAAASEEGHARIWDTMTGKLEHTLSAEDERMLSLVFSADSKSIVTGSENLRIWDVATGELQHTLSAPDDRSLSFTAMHERGEYPYPAEIYTVDFTLDGKSLVSGCPNTATVCIWNTESWKLEHIIRGYYAACFSPDGKHLAIPTNDHRTIQIYDTLTWQLQSTLENNEDEFFPAVFSPDSKTLATYSGRQIKLWSVESSEIISIFEDPERKLSTPVFSPDGILLISGARKCGLRVWSVESRDCLLMLDPEGGARDPWNPKGVRGGPPAFEVLFSDGGAKAAIAFPDGSIKIWDVMWESS